MKRWLAALVVATAGPAFAGDWREELTPLKPGKFPLPRPQTGVYRFGWGAVSAAEAQIAFSRQKDDQLQLKLTAKTTGAVRALWQRSSVGLPAPVLFAAVTLVAGFVVYSLFLRALNYYTQPWYYITLFAFSACALDVVFGAWPLRGLRPLVALVLLSFTVAMSWKELPTRHTNVDLIAAQIQRLSEEGDIVVVPRWECAISFSRYYHGKAEVVTIPPIEDHRVHRYDLVLEQMKTPDAHQPVLDRMEKALRSGHRVFFAGTLPFDASSAPLPILFPPYQDPHGGWQQAPYYAVWKLQAGRFLHAHTTKVVGIAVALPPGSEVQRFENLEPEVVEGWQ